MAEKTVTSKLGLADFEVATISYKTMVTNVGFRQSRPEEEEVTYANESTGGEFSVGSTLSRITVSGIVRYDSANTAPFIPIEDFENVAIEATIVTGCTVSGTGSFVDVDLGLPAGATRRFTASARITGAVVVAWDESGA